MYTVRIRPGRGATQFSHIKRCGFGPLGWSMTTSLSSARDDAATSSRTSNEVSAAFILAQLTFSRDRPSSAPCITGWPCWCFALVEWRSGHSSSSQLWKSFLKVGYPSACTCQCALKRTRVEKFFYARTGASRVADLSSELTSRPPMLWQIQDYELIFRRISSNFSGSSSSAVRRR